MLHLIALAWAEVPVPTYPDCGTPEDDAACPSDLERDWALLSWVPSTYTEADPSETATGISADRAWATSTGRTDVVIAVLDSGIFWDDTRLRRKIALNVAELPAPQDSDGLETAFDRDGNGVVNVDDYALDPRVDPNAHPHGVPDEVDAGDLILAFSDGSDDDGNGFVDDIAGWDFLWNDNDPYDEVEFDHGTYEAAEAAQEAEDGRGGVGVCPNCMVLPLRVGDSFVADGSHFGLATVYATELDVEIILEALGTLNHPSWVTQAISDAWDAGTLVVASAADETAYHQNSPGWVDRTLYVHAIVPNEDDRSESSTFLAYSNCTNHGARLQLSASSTGCSSGATAITAGTAGLVISAARDQGRELTPAQVVGILQVTAEDIHQDPDPLLYPSVEGWDRHFGYGRIHAERAVEAAIAEAEPPTAEITSPSWFAFVDPSATPTLEVDFDARGGSDSYRLEWGWGDQPSEWTLFYDPGWEGPAELHLSELIGADYEAVPPLWDIGDDAVSREEAVNLHTLTLRLTVDGEGGASAEARKSIVVHHDPDALEGFPLDLGASMESSPNLVDLDGDGVLDIVVGDADGFVHALTGQGTELPGWPVQTDLLEDARGVDAHESMIASVAVGDLDGDGSLEVVAAGLRGRVYAWSASGALVSGFPVSQDAVGSTDPEHLYDEGFFSSPALGDLDGDGDLDIVIGGMDQQVYAWDEAGAALAGFPVRLGYEGYEHLGTRIVSSPAVGDLDGDGDLEIVLGTNETLNGYNGAVYALHHDGGLVEGWPQSVLGAFTQVLPYVGEGVPVSPALADLDGDGDLEVAAWTQAGDFNVFEHDGSARMLPDKAMDRFGEQTNVPDGASFPLINNPSFGDLNGDDRPDLVSGGTGADYAVGLIFDGRRMPFSHTLNAWDGQTGAYFPAWPQQMEDMQFFANPAIADLDGDWKPEVITGTAGFLVHAIDVDGQQPSGWPKLTGHWNMASPAVGDIDGDGRLDVVTTTRAGLVFAWTTASASGAPVEWAGFGHDPQNTGNYEAPLPQGYNTLSKPEDEARRCGCGSPVSAGAWLGLLALAALRRRR
jgi:hypothetical protein